MGAFQKVVGYILTFSMAVCLILAWVLTAPLLRCSIHLADFYRHRFSPALASPRVRARIPK